MNTILKFGISIVLIFFGYRIITSYYNKERIQKIEVKISKYEKLVNSPKIINALLDSQYLEKTEKKVEGKIKKYQMSYTFEVNGVEYHGRYEIDNEPQIPIIEVKYLEEDPNINSINPERDLIGIKDQRNQGGVLKIGITLIILGVLFGLYQIYKIRKEKKEIEYLT